MARVRFVLSVAVAVVLLSLATRPARSNDGVGYQGWFALAGVSVSPDQFVVGGKTDFGKMADHFRIYLGGDLGFGDHTTSFTIGPEFVFHDQFENRAQIYLGLVPALSYVNVKVTAGDIERRTSNSDFGFAAVGGYMHPAGRGHFVFDVKVGIDSYADAKFMAGYRFAKD